MGLGASASTATRNVFHEMLGNIQTGRWPVGAAIPSERSLIDEFGVSRIAIREALSMLKGLGTLDVTHGRRTRVRMVGSEAISHLLPIMLASGSRQTLDHVFEVRLALESRTAHLAAQQRTAAQIERLRSIAASYRLLANKSETEAVAADLEFHLYIASITGNPLYPILLEALAEFIVLAQKESCRDDPVRRRRAALAHEAIVAAISEGDYKAARNAMEDHLRYSAARRRRGGGPRK